MNKKIIAFLFCVAFAMQSESMPMREQRETPATVSIRDGQIRLAKFVMEELDKIAHIKMTNSKNLAEKILSDPKVLEIKTSNMESHLQDFRQFIEHCKNYGDKPIVPMFGGDKLMSEEEALFRKYKNFDTTTEGSIISKALKENGVDNQVALLYEPIWIYTQKFTSEAENYKVILDVNDADEKNKTEVENLIKSIEALTDAKKRGDSIINFIQKFDLDFDGNMFN